VKKKILILFLLSTILVGLVAFSTFVPKVESATTNISVSIDSYITSAYPDNNYGTGTVLHSGRITGAYMGTCRSYLKFSLSSLSSGISITSVKLWLRVISDYNNPLSGIYSTSDSWTETGITWNNAPSSTTLLDSKVVDVSGNQWVDWSVTSYVIEENSGDKVASFMARAVDETAPDKSYDAYAREWDSYDAYLEVTYLNYPVNDSLELTNPSISTQGCLAQKQAYIFRAKVTDSDGGADINRVLLSLGGGSGIAKWTQATDAFSVYSSGQWSLSSTSSDSTLSGSQWTLDFKITFYWTFPDENLHTMTLTTVDDSEFSDADNYSNLFYVENDLISSGRTVNDYRVNPSQSLTFSGTLYYQGTTITPNDGNYNVAVKLGGVTKATDTTLVSGAFSASANAESTVNSYAYNVDFNYETGSDTFTAVIVDKILVTIAANSTNPTNFQKVQLTTTAKYQYNSTDVTTLSFQMTRNGSNFSTSTPVVDGAYTDTVYVYTTSSSSETTYGLNQFSTNTITVTWGANFFIEIYDVSSLDLRLDVNAQAYTYYRGRFSNNQSAVSSGTLYYKLNATGTQYSASFNSSGWACLNGSRSSVGKIYLAVSAVNVNGETDVSAITETHWIVWDRLEIVSVAASNTYINMSGTFELPFSSSEGSVNGFSFDADNGWWEKTVTASSSAVSTNYNETYITISDDTYGLTVKNASSVNVITDGLKVSQSLDLDNLILSLRLMYAYNDSAISGGSVYFAGSTQVTNSSGWASYALSSLSDFSWGQTAYGVSDVAYGITYKAENQTIPLEKFGTFLINTQVAHSVASTQWQSSILSFYVSGTGSATIKVYYSGSLIPYYVKINGMIRVEGDSWSKSSGLVTITDALGSTHTYSVGFQPLSGTPTGGSPQGISKADENVQTMKEIIYRLSSNWISVILLLVLLVATVVAYAVDSSPVWQFLLVGFVALAINFLLVFVVIPQGLLPSDLAFLEQYAFKPPSLELSTLPIATQSIIQIAVMSFLLCSVMGSVAMLIYRGEE